MTLSDFGQPVLNLPEAAARFDTYALPDRYYRITIDTDRGLQAAEYLLELLDYSPPDILSMSW